jgi:hypothetical protein
MSTRASLIASLDTKPKVLAESVGWIPLLWTPLISSADLARSADDSSVQVDRREAIERCGRAIDFCAGLFPEFGPLTEVADDFLGRLRKLKATTIAVEFHDHAAISPGTFLPCLAVAVAAIEAHDGKARFFSPAVSLTNPFTGKKMKTTPARTLKTTRDVLCCALSLDPVVDNDELMRDQLVGSLFI